jgi:DNA polymerase-3 subunit alpha
VVRRNGSDGLIALSGAHLGDVGEALLNGNFDLAGERARPGRRSFPGAFYLEVQRYGQPQQEAIVQQTADLAGELGLPLVATHPVQFMNRDDFRAHEARVCIAEGYVLGDSRRPKPIPKSSISRPRPKWPSCLPTCRKRWRTRWKSPSAAISN